MYCNGIKERRKVRENFKAAILLNDKRNTTVNRSEMCIEVPFEVYESDDDFLMANGESFFRTWRQRLEMRGCRLSSDTSSKQPTPSQMQTAAAALIDT